MEVSSSAQLLQPRGYKYQPLDISNREIRLLLLNPASRLKRLECSIITVSLNSKLDYQALSYTWGTSIEDHAIFVDDQPYPVSSNLHAALTQLRSSTKTQSVWIDRICINQDDILERNKQVAQMRAIYESASQVVVWLGSESKNSAGIIESLDRLASAIINEEIQLRFSLPPDDLGVASDIERIIRDQELGEIDFTSQWLAGIIELLDRPWWSRVWVRQEFAVARRVNFLWGATSINWNSIKVCLGALRSLVQSNILDPQRTNIRSCNLILRRHFYVRLRDDVQSGRKSSLLALTWRHARSPAAEATDSRDRIYALLGISNNSLGIEPDYSIETAILYSQFVKAHIRAEGRDPRRLAILSAHHDRSQPRLSSLSSWALDFATRAGNPMATIIPGSPRRYFASGTDQLPALEDSFDVNPKVLPLTGIGIGTIKAIGPNGTLATITKSGQLNSIDTEIFGKCGDLARAVEELASGYASSILNPNDISSAKLNITEIVGRILILDVGFDLASSDKRNRAQDSILSLYNNILGREDPPEEFMPHEELEVRRMAFSRRYVQEVRTRLHKRQIFLTSNGNVGVGPESLQVDDTLCVLLGAEVPFILRKEEEQFLIVGEAYVHGYMDGEALEGIKRQKVFNLV